MSTIAERFVIEETLGMGGMGTVYRAQDSMRGATVALKTLHSVDPTTLLRFKNEFRALTNLAHPNLLQLYELVSAGDKYLLSMELVQGKDFLAHVRSRGGAAFERNDDGATESVPEASAVSFSPATRTPRRSGGALLADLDEEKLREALRQLAEGLRALHDSGRLHRDLKPANVLVFNADDRLVICDFGLVVESAVHAKGTGDTTRGGLSGVHTTTVNNEVCGTLAFMSPEQASGGELTTQSDWYSVGVMLYQALTLRVPFDPHLPWGEAVKAKSEVMPPHPLTIAPNAPADLAELTMALLAAEPDRRAGYEQVMAVITGRAAKIEQRADLPELLIGREGALRQLTAAFSYARGGTASVATVCGASGMGKSALVRRFLEGSVREGAVVLQGRCYEREDLPYKAVDPLMDALSHLLVEWDDEAVSSQLVPDDVGYLRRLFPVLSRVPCVANKVDGVEVADPFLQKQRAASAFKTICQRLTETRPLVLYVDDLQWGDSDSSAFFMELLRGEDAPPLLLLFAYRAENEDTSELLKGLRDHYSSELEAEQLAEIRVEALSDDDARRLSNALLAGASVSRQMVTAIVQEAQGSPFFIRELCAFVGTGQHKRGPLRLATVIEDRVASLPESARALLECAAVAGRPELARVIEAASGVGTKTFSAMQVLKAHSLLQSSGVDEWARVEAAHDRIRETVVSGLSPERKRKLHRMLAVNLEQVADQSGQPRDVEALFRHWSGAGEGPRAAQCAIEAAENAERTLAFGHAARLYTQALELLADDPRRHSELHEKRGRALMFAGHGAAAADAFLKAMEEAPPERSQELRREALTQLLRAGQLTRAFEGLQDAEDVLGVRFPRSNLAAIVTMLWRKLRIRLDDRHLPAAAMPCPEEVTRKLDNLHRISIALSSIDFLRGAVYTAELTLRAFRAGDPRLVALALTIEAIRSASANDKPARTEWVTRRGRELSQRSQDRYVIAVTAGSIGVSRYLEGRFEEGIRGMRESTRIHRDELHSRYAWDLVVDLVFELRAHAQIGRVHEVITRVPDAIRDAEARGDTYAMAMLRLGRLSWAWLGADQPHIAREQMLTAQRIWTQAPYQLFHYYALQSFVDLSLYEDEAEEAFERLTREWKPMLLVRKIQFCRIEAHFMRARLALALAQKHQDKKLLSLAKRDAIALGKENVAWSRALSSLVHASLAAFESKDAALRLLPDAGEDLERRDMRLIAACVRHRVGELLPGAHGEEQLAASRATITKLGVRCPDRFVRMLAPGFPLG